MLTTAGRLRAQAIGGEVRGAAGRPLGGVLVGLLDETARWVASARTAGDGKFVADVPRPGRYEVVIVPAAGRLYRTPPEGVGADAFIQHAYPVPDSVADTTVYLAREVTDSARFRRDALPRPVYPPELRDRGVRGWVTVVVVVGADGRPEPASIRTIHASEAAFAASAVDALTAARFTPAVRDGRPVRQLWPLAFDYGFGREPAHGDVTVRTWASPFGHP